MINPIVDAATGTQKVVKLFMFGAHYDALVEKKLDAGAASVNNPLNTPGD